MSIAERSFILLILAILVAQIAGTGCGETAAIRNEDARIAEARIFEGGSELPVADGPTGDLRSDGLTVEMGRQDSRSTNDLAMATDSRSTNDLAMATDSRPQHLPVAMAGYVPSKAIASYSTDYTAQVASIQPLFRSLPEPGYKDTNLNDYTVSRGAFSGVSGTVFRHKIVKGMQYRQDNGYQSARAELFSRWGGEACFKIGTAYWTTLSIFVAADHPFDGSGDDLDFWELGHGVKSKNGTPNIAGYIRRNGTMDFLVHSNPILDAQDPSGKISAKYALGAIKKGVWIRFAAQVKLNWDATKGPYLKMWRSVNGSAPALVFNHEKPNTYHESVNYNPWKFGLYLWNINTGWGNSSSRTIYTKGVRVYLDDGVMTAERVLAAE